MQVITGASIDRYRLCVLRSAVKLEALGMRKRGQSATAAAAQLLGVSKRNRTLIIQLLNERLSDDKN